MTVMDCLKKARERYDAGLVKKINVSFNCLRSAELMRERNLTRHDAMVIAHQEYKKVI